METLLALLYWPLVGASTAVLSVLLMSRGVGRRWIVYAIVPIIFLSAGGVLGLLALRLHLHGVVLQAVIGQSETSWGLMLLQFMMIGSVVGALSPMIARFYAEKRAAELDADDAADSGSHPKEKVRGQG